LNGPFKIVHNFCVDWKSKLAITARQHEKKNNSDLKPQNHLTENYWECYLDNNLPNVLFCVN